SQRNVGNYPFQWLQNNWLKVTAAISGAIMVVRGIASAFGSTIDTIKNFQTASNELSAITGMSGAGLKDLENAAIEMSTSVDTSG
ncbi:hypothetical protein, partial [Xylella fastidiosa]|uniref:hypothetical protein n=1 Tax=Xylella fastidiosa TaxID=2371 RepID=UPI00138A3679